MKNLCLGLVILATYGCASSTYYYQSGEKKTLTPVKSIERSNQEVDYYETQNGAKVGVNDTLMVKFSNLENLDAYLSEYNLKIVEKITTNMYELQAQDKSLTIEVANALSQKSDVEYAHPNFIKTRDER